VEKTSSPVTRDEAEALVRVETISRFRSQRIPLAFRARPSVLARFCHNLEGRDRFTYISTLTWGGARRGISARAAKRCRDHAPHRSNVTRTALVDASSDSCTAVHAPPRCPVTGGGRAVSDRADRAERGQTPATVVGAMRTTSAGAPPRAGPCRAARRGRRRGLGVAARPAPPAAGGGADQCREEWVGYGERTYGRGGRRVGTTIMRGSSSHTSQAQIKLASSRGWPEARHGAAGRGVTSRGACTKRPSRDRGDGRVGHDLRTARRSVAEVSRT